MKQFKILFDRFFLNKLEKLNPQFYRFITYNAYKIYSEIINKIKYNDRYFFHSVSFEISVFCNRKCDYCPNKEHETPKVFMPMEVFYRGIDELKKLNYSGIIQYHFFNEPLYDDRLVEFVKYTKEHLPKAIIVLISNGDLLNIEKAKELVVAGVNKFVVTVHDKNPIYNLNRLKPVKDFLKEKMRLQTTENLYLANRGGAVNIKSHKRKTKFKKCPDIRTLIITNNGDVVLCCQDYFRQYIRGNIMEKSILDIWNSYKDIREDLLKRNKVKLPICKTCLERD